jgi:hypothetical protein
MVVALDLERHRFAVAEIEHAGVLSRPLEDPLAARGQTLQRNRGVLVAAVLRPEQREHGELEVVRGPVKQLADTVELLVREAECTVERLLDDPCQGPESRRAGG